MQEVLRFLRRSEDTAEMELSLMAQDRLRLQKQVSTPAVPGPLWAQHRAALRPWGLQALLAGEGGLWGPPLAMLRPSGMSSSSSGGLCLAAGGRGAGTGEEQAAAEGAGAEARGGAPHLTWSSGAEASAPPCLPPSPCALEVIISLASLGVYLCCAMPSQHCSRLSAAPWCLASGSAGAAAE